MLTKVFAYKQWADRRTMLAAHAIDSARHPGPAGFVRQQFNHMVIVEELFRARLQGRDDPHEATNTDVPLNLIELARRLEESDRWLLQYTTDALPSQLEQVHRFVFTDGLPGSMAAQEVLLHLLTHGNYHRGSIAHALDLAAVPHPPDSYPKFVHTAEPQRRWLPHRS